MKEDAARLEQVIVCSEVLQKMKNDTSINIVMTAPVPWSQDQEYLVGFWRKDCPPACATMVA